MPAPKVDVAVFLLWSLFSSGQGVALRPDRSYHPQVDTSAGCRHIYMEETPMILSAELLTAAINADPHELLALGWRNEALPARRQVLETLHAWLTGGQIESPASVQLLPLVAVWQSEVPAAKDAELLLMMLELGRVLVTTATDQG